MTELEAESPAPFVAEQVRVVPEVFDVRFAGPQPEDEEIPDGSVTLQVMETGLVYQPLAPRVPLTVGVIMGGAAPTEGPKVKVPGAISPPDPEDMNVPAKAPVVASYFKIFRDALSPFVLVLSAYK